MDDDLPIIPRRLPPPPRPETVPFVAKLDHPPLDRPKRARPDPVQAWRDRAEYLALWMACRRALCRQARRCLGPHARCLVEEPGVTRPLLDVVVEGMSEPR